MLTSADFNQIRQIIVETMTPILDTRFLSSEQRIKKFVRSEIQREHRKTRQTFNEVISHFDDRVRACEKRLDVIEHKPSFVRIGEK